MSGSGIWMVSHYPLNANTKSRMQIDGKISEVSHDIIPVPSKSLQGMFTNYDRKQQKIIGFTIQDIITAIEHVASCSCLQQATEVINSNDYRELLF
jgi:hypothetical protein